MGGNANEAATLDGTSPTYPVWSGTEQPSIWLLCRQLAAAGQAPPRRQVLLDLRRGAGIEESSWLTV